MFKFILATFFPLMIFTDVSAQENVLHPIEIRLKHCHDTDTEQSTLSMIQCEIQARDDWDLEMNKFYRLLMDTIPVEKQNLLRKTQQNWITLRDARKYVQNFGSYEAKEFCAQRAMELKNYYEISCLLEKEGL